MEPPLATNRNNFINLLQEFSIPLLAGVAVAMVSANMSPEWYLSCGCCIWHTSTQC